MKENSRAEIFDIITYLASSARCVLDEVPRNGALRMLKSIEMLVDLESKSSDPNDRERVFLKEIKSLIKANEGVYSSGDKQALETFLNSLTRQFARELQRQTA